MPGVTVTARNTQTQQTVTTATDGTGFYTFPNLLPGRYDILAELQGFKTIRRENVQLDATANLTLDLAMPTGIVSEEVLVTARSPLPRADATANPTGTSGAIVGIQNVDAIQEVQVLTANYMPEYGRASGGQIRFVTKSGSSKYSGSGSYFLRSDKLQANTWSRNRSPNAIENSRPAPYNYKQYGYAFGGPIPGNLFKDRLFFFGAKEWGNYRA